jgi:tetratricopeptide (TPR) repeat protein
VSVKTDKLIEEAQKLAMKGQNDKAIKAYQQAMALEPLAANHRQKMAELLVKAGRNDDARSEFEAIGKKYTSDGFYLKAIAVYKKLQGMFPGDIPIILTLASLNEKHGLVANALAEYKQVYDYYEKHSEKEDALKILEKMESVDPQNIHVKQKLAEAYFQGDRKDEAYTVFGKLATLLHERGDSAAFTKLDARIQQLFPKKSEFTLEVLAEQVASGNAALAVTGLQTLLRTNSNDKRVWDLIVEAFRNLNQTQKVKVAYQHYLKCFPDELTAQIGLIGCLADESDLKGAVALLDNYELGLFAGRFLEGLERIYRALDKIDPINVRVLEGLSRVLVAAGKGDEAAAIESKIKSLQGVSAKKVEVSAAEEEQSFDEPDSFSGQASDEPDFGDVSFADINTDESELEVEYEAGTVEYPNPFDQAEDDVEIEVEFDVDTELEVPSDETEPIIADEDWLVAAGKIIDKIATQAGKVKFAQALDGEDAQSHYDLGMAFMEMGLYDESFKEFRQASADDSKRFICYIFQGVCLREKGDLVNAEMVLRSLVKPGCNLEDTCTARYELALTCEAAGKSEEYVSLLTEIDGADRNFRDVGRRLDALHSDKHDLDFSDDDFKMFDV